MLHEIIHLNQYYNLSTDPELEILIPYVRDDNKRNKSKGIVICGGGAYSFVSIRESDSVAIEYMRKGFCTFILRYTTRTPYPTPMNELACAIDYLRKNADKYYLIKDKISIVGFSAGGHLVSSFGYLYKHPDFINKTSHNPNNIKPNAIISCYPVITMGKYTHQETKSNITGDDDNLIDFLSVEKNIDSEYPPTFVWTTKPDTVVPYINSIMYVDALKDNNIPHEFHLYEELDHGKSIGTDLINDIEDNQIEAYNKLQQWVINSIYFINKIM